MRARGTQPGPNPTDVAVLVRNRLWAWVVYCSTQEASSWGQLDDHWLWKIEEGTPGQPQVPKNTKQRRVHEKRRRVFERYFWIGNDPAKLKGTNTRFLLEVVHEDPAQRAAASLYDSPLWELTGPSEPSIPRVREIQADLLGRLGLIRLSPAERAVARFAGLADAAHNNQDLQNISENAFNIAAMASVDAIALLGCAYRLAMDALSLKEADIYLEGLRWGVGRFLIRWGRESAVAIALKGLIELRLLRRTAEPVQREWLGFKVRDRRKCARNVAPVKDEDGWLEEPFRLMSRAKHSSPIVPNDEAMQKFFLAYPSHCEALRDEVINQLASLNQQHRPESHGDEADDAMLYRDRQKMIDAVLLEILSADDDTALRYQHYFRFVASGSETLWGILDSFLNPKVS